MAKICSGCGAQIQSSDQKRPGYVPPDLLSRENVICQRCFKISHYNQLTPVTVNPEHFNTILKKIGQEKALVVKIIDLFDFNGSMLPGFARLMRFNPVVVAINKIDLLPRVNWGRIKEWIKRQIETWGMKPVDLVFVSGSNGSGIMELLSAIRNHRQGRDVYLVGAANVGKSTLINQILNYTDQEADLKLTTSRFPGTTLDLIAIPLKDGTVLYDTPGVISGEQITHYLSAEDLKLVLPQKQLKPKIYQLNPQQTLFFGGLARLDFIAGARSSFVCYMADSLPIHRSKLERADRLYRRHLGELLHPPRGQSLSNWGPLEKHTFQLDEPADLVIAGLGWVAFKGEKGEVTLHAPHGVKVLKRTTLI